MAKSNPKVTKDMVLSYLEKKAPDELLEITMEALFTKLKKSESSTATPEFAFNMGILTAWLYQIIKILRSDTKLSEVRLRIEKE